VDDGAVTASMNAALAAFERSGGESPFKIQHELQDVMQDLVGIVRQDGEMRQALDHLAKLQERAERVSVSGHREYNTGWHTALDLRRLLTVSEAITRAAIERRESRGGHFREDFPNKEAAFSKVNFAVRKGKDGRMEVASIPLPEMPAELKTVIEEMG
jgi:succinate dehydrogenase flavoprotein subunit